MMIKNYWVNKGSRLHGTYIFMITFISLIFQITLINGTWNWKSSTECFMQETCHTRKHQCYIFVYCCTAEEEEEPCMFLENKHIKGNFTNNGLLILPHHPHPYVFRQLLQSLFLEHLQSYIGLLIHLYMVYSTWSVKWIKVAATRKKLTWFLWLNQAWNFCLLGYNTLNIICKISGEFRYVMLGCYIHTINYKGFLSDIYSRNAGGCSW